MFFLFLELVADGPPRSPDDVAELRIWSLEAGQLLQTLTFPARGKIVSLTWLEGLDSDRAASFACGFADGHVAVFQRSRGGLVRARLIITGSMPFTST